MAFRSATQDEKQEILERARSFLHQHHIETYTTEIIQLPFYPDTRLVRLETPAPSKKYAFIFTSTETFFLQPHSGAVQTCNAHAPLMLSEAAIHGYARFFYFYERGLHVFEAKIRRSAVGYSGKIWVFEPGGFFETDINISMHGSITELEKTPIPDVPEFDHSDFVL